MKNAYSPPLFIDNHYHYLCKKYNRRSSYIVDNISQLCFISYPHLLRLSIIFRNKIEHGNSSF